MDTEKRQLFSIYKSEEDKNKIILDNTILMLSNRIYIDKDGSKHPLLNYENASNTVDKNNDGVYIINADNGEKYALKIIYGNVTKIGKQSTVYIFLKDYAKINKIIVATSFRNKIEEYVSEHQTQIFLENILLLNLIDHFLMPKFEPLSPIEMEMVRSEYGITQYTTKKMVFADPIVKYFNLKIGDFIRIIRPSPTTGEAIDYRVVVD